MTTPRQRVWFTAAGTNNTYATSYESDVSVPEGTIERMIGTVLFASRDTPPAGQEVLGTGWSFNVGPAAVDPAAGGINGSGVLLKKLLIVPAPDGHTAISPIPVQNFDSDGGRIVGTGDSLWFAGADALGGLTWLWAYEVRILILLP